jgi:plasmid stability protein
MAQMIAIRNVDPDTYRRFKAQATLEGRTVGAALSEAMEEYLQRAKRMKPKEP